MHWSVGAAGRSVSRGGRRSAAQRAADTDRWVAARTAGITSDAIAAQAGVGAATVSRATPQFGPFPPATARRGPGPPFLTVVQIGDELAVGPHVVYDLVGKGGLPARQVAPAGIRSNGRGSNGGSPTSTSRPAAASPRTPGDFARNRDSQYRGRCRSTTHHTTQAPTPATNPNHQSPVTLCPYP